MRSITVFVPGRIAPTFPRLPKSARETPPCQVQFPQHVLQISKVVQIAVRFILPAELHAKEARERAFSRFTRLDQRQGEGAGLGLAIARRIAELHKGSLTLGDRDDGGPGLCVSVWLPASA